MVISCSLLFFAKIILSNFEKSYNKFRKGKFYNLANCQYRIPYEWDMGKVFSNLILKLGGNLIDRTYEIYNSWIEPKISDYNIAVYFMPTDYLYESYLEGELLD